jgi:hypothetical protein
MANEKRGRRTRKPFLLRLDEELRLQIADRARESDRSLNGEITQRLRQSLRTTDGAATGYLQYRK